MKKLIVLFIATSLLFAGTFVSAEETLPLNAVNRANEVIDAALEAYGGAEALANLNSLARKSHFTNWAINQSRVPGPPWDESELINLMVVDFESDTFVGKNKGSGNGFDFDGHQIIKGEEGWQIDYLAGTVTPIAEPDFNTTSGPFIRITAPLLVKQLQSRRQTSHWLGEVEFNDRLHDVITLVMEVGPALSLYFDQETHLLSRSERVLPPFGQVDYRFTDYEAVDGILFNKSFMYFVNDDPVSEVDYISTVVNQPIEKYTALPTDLEMLEAAPPAPTEVLLQEVKEGIYFAGAGTTYVMFVEMDDFVIAVGGTAGIPDRITALREKIGDKPVNYGVITHHHNDHVLGVATYEVEGATVLGLKQHEAVIRAAATDGDALKLQFVDGKYVFDGGKLELYDIGPTPHAEHILVAFAPESGVLFEADHFVSPANGRMPPAQPVTRHLAKAIDKLGLDVKVILSSHSPRIASIDDLNKSLSLAKAKAKKASQ